MCCEEWPSAVPALPPAAVGSTEMNTPSSEFDVTGYERIRPAFCGAPYVCGSDSAL